MHSVHCMRIPNIRQAKIRFVTESATLLHFFDLHCCLIFVQNRSKKGKIAESATVFTCLLRSPKTINTLKNSLTPIEKKFSDKVFKNLKND